MVTLLEIGRKVFLFTLIIDILDTIAVTTFIALGTPPPAIVSFVPPEFVKYTIMELDFLRHIYVPNFTVFIISLAFLSTFMAIGNFMIGVTVGWLYFVFVLTSFFGLTFANPLVDGLLLAAAVLQAISYYYIITQILMIMQV
jgi:hypothetical protein